MSSISIQKIDKAEFSRYDLIRFEQETGVNLPSDYRNFLWKYQGEVFLTGNHIEVDLGFQKEELAVVQLNSIATMKMGSNYLKSYNQINGLIPIGSTLGGGQFWGLGVDEQNYNKVYLVEPDFSRYVVEDSFSSFLDSIKFESGS